MVAKFIEHYTPRIETGKGDGLSKMTGHSKSWMGTKRSNKALPEMIPPRICVIFRRASFWSRSKSSKIMFWELQAENTVNIGPGSRGNFFENVQNHEHLSKRDPYDDIRLLGLRIKDFESQSCYEPNGTTGDPQNSDIDKKSAKKSIDPTDPTVH